MRSVPDGVRLAAACVLLCAAVGAIAYLVARATGLS